MDIAFLQEVVVSKHDGQIKFLININNYQYSSLDLNLIKLCIYRRCYIGQSQFLIPV